MATSESNQPAEDAEGAFQPWSSLFGAGLSGYLTLPEARRCRLICPAIARFSSVAGQRDPYEGSGSWKGAGLPGGISEPLMEALWKEDLGLRRGHAWQELLLGGITLQQRAGTHQDYYEQLCKQPSKFDSAIKRDVHRTLPSEELFKEKGGQGQQALFRLLRALAIRLWDIGYCQSLNLIVATLIGIFPDDETAVFNCSLALLLRHSLVDLYRPKFPKLGVLIWQFDKIVEGFLPKVHAALSKYGVNSEYYAIQWFLTLFASDLPQSIVRRIWDRFLVAGWRVIVQVGLALMYKIQDEIPELDMCQALCFLKKFTRMKSYDVDDLLQTAASFKVSHRLLSALEAAYNWEGDAQLTVIKDLNSGQVHWSVQNVSKTEPTPGLSEEDVDEAPPMPRAFIKGGGSQGGYNDQEPDGEERNGGNVLPFLLHNLDTGETRVMDRAFKQYRGDLQRKAKATAGPVVAPRKNS